MNGKKVVENKRYIDDSPGKKEILEDNVPKITLGSRILELEDYYADNFLSPEIREIYKRIQEDCADFRENIFLKNINIIENDLGIYNKKNNLTIKEKEKHFEEMLREVKKPDVLLKEFEKKVVK